MKKTRLISLLLAAMLITTLFAGCRSEAPPTSQAPSTGTSEPPAVGTGEVSQGITDDEILLGTVGLLSGNYAFFGVPVLAGLQSCIDRLNAEGGIRGRKVRLIAYDYQADAALAKTLIEKLVEEDKVFALCNLGIDQLYDYYKEKNIPVIGVSSVTDRAYSENDPSSRFFPINPSWEIDGRYLLARVLHESLFGPNKDEKLPDDAKLAVVCTIDEYSQTILKSLQAQAELEGVSDRLVIETVSTDTVQASIQKFKNEGCQAVLLTQYVISEWFVAAMDDAQWEVPFFASYGASTIASYAPETYKESRPLYAGIWTDFNTPKGQTILDDMVDALSYSSGIDEATRESYRYNNYCVAGYSLSKTLVAALKRFDENPELDLTWDNLIKVMEMAPFEWGDVEWSYANGRRMGIESLCVFEYYGYPNENPMREDYAIVRPFESLEEVMAK